MVGCLVAGSQEGPIQLWDLRRIRRQLAEIGLDWDDSNDSSSSGAAGLRVNRLARRLTTSCRSRRSKLACTAWWRWQSWGGRFVPIQLTSTPLVAEGLLAIG